METKLEGLHIKKVDFVDQGANQMANIKIKKSKDGEEISNPEVGLFKRFVNWLTGELSKSDSEITKSATTFNEQINAVSMDAIRDEIWSTCYALQNSLNSILCDAEMDSSAKQAAMETSTEQFAEAMKGYIPNWASGTATNIRKNLDTPDKTDLQMVMKAHKNLTDIIEILILTYLIYHIAMWLINTKAWMLMRGIVVLGIFVLLAAVFKMHTILFLARNSVTVLATAAVVVFQPELRRALEKLGEKQFLSSIVPFETNKESSRFSEDTMDSIIDAAYNMGRVKTGALIVVEQAIHLTEYESTGIKMDCLVSMQVLMNIFEHNTPLHDGAIIIRGDRIVSATCYLPLSDNMGLSKELGTRHRAAVGMSEVSDALIIVVSEENGKVSVAQGGVLDRAGTREELREKLTYIQNRKPENKNFLQHIWKGRNKDEKRTDE